MTPTPTPTENEDEQDTTEEDTTATDIEVIQESEEEASEDTPNISENDGYMQREVNGKLVGYTLENTYEGCPIIDALNDADYEYRENFFPDTNTSRFPNMVDTFGTLKIAHGNINGLFEPKREITRAEFTKMVLISHCYTYNEEDTQIRRYTDVEANTWEARVVSKAEKLGIINGYSDKSFKPNQVITKAEATKILMRMAMVQANTLENMSYTDVLVDWHKKYVQIGETL